jgi:formylglycine-generating enzyme required for sulfatase activity
MTHFRGRATVHFLKLIAAASLALACALTAALAPARAEKRVALVIGNGDYRNMPKLKNAPNDARDLAAALQRLDFEVDLGVDLLLAGMQEKLQAFAKRAQTADVALAFFAGHGVQAPDPLGTALAVNYLLPVDVGEINEPADLNGSFVVTARDILARLQAATRVRILILDACRSNPIPQRFARGRGGSVSRGLVREPRTAGTLIAYSTQPDTTADDGPERNSPFMKALLAHIDEPVDIRLVFADVRNDVTAWTKDAQTPETSDSLKGRFMFRSGAADDPAGPQAAVVVTPSPSTRPPEPNSPLTAERERALKPGQSFRECENCPEMVVLPAGSFTMGSPEGEQGRYDDEGPQHAVTIGKPFAAGRLHVTRDQFEAFVRESRSRSTNFRDPGFAQDGKHPAVRVTWDEAKAYADWLANKTGKPYRLLSEAEWEYAARGQTSPGAYPRFWFGTDDNAFCRNGNGADQKARDSIEGARDWSTVPCNDGYAYTSPAGHYTPNAFGLFDMAGNAWQWTADCWHGDYAGAPADGTAWTAGDCSLGHVIRGGSWLDRLRDLRAAARDRATVERDHLGFRLARTLAP